MPNSPRSGNALADFVSALIELIFHPLFPLIFITLPVVSLLLASASAEPAFEFWFLLGVAVCEYAMSRLWTAICGAAFILAALPLAWVFFREQQVVVSAVIKQWLATLIAIGLLIWLDRDWRDNGSAWQATALNSLLLIAWAGMVEASIGTLAIIKYACGNRLAKPPPPPQEPHGRRRRRRRTEEPETI